MDPRQSENSASTIATAQYEGTTKNLERRIAIYTYSTNPQSWFSFLSSNIGAVIGTSPKILDVGAGTGELWNNVSLNSSTDLTLADFSAAMCTKLRALDIHNARIEVVQCDAAKMPFEAESFDILIASHLLHHVESPSACLAEFARVIRPGGYILVSLGSSRVNELIALSHKLGRISLARNYNKITAETAITEVGKYFQDIRQEVYVGDLEVPSPEPVLDYLESLPDGVMNENHRKRAVDMVEKEIVERGNFTVHNSRSLFIATKP
ncbi:S-adenosyl-L-methionine-dependent methyltransferase [Tothia fuscella]|uniref:S-adenosyl-L-methionine-dependent methyltransferase n=1 Tax=Tothia fuscella TaxID=1048955 RepID=A0A9P4U1Y5_9PEZI|nr:S-adenosyl-L-methionine-dependent methyltransferase [Tothia fuscella]